MSDLAFVSNVLATLPSLVEMARLHPDLSHEEVAARWLSVPSSYRVPASYTASDALVEEVAELEAEKERLGEWETAIGSIWQLDGVGPKTLRKCIDSMSDLITQEAERAEQAEAELAAVREALGGPDGPCTVKNITGRMKEAEDMGWQCGRQYQERALFEAEAERDTWHTRFSILQTAASGAGDRECQHESISGNVCDWCGAYIKTVRLDDVGLVADILDYQQAEAKLENQRKNNLLLLEKLEQAEAEVALLIKRHDGEQKAKAKAEQSSLRWFKAATLAEAKQHHAEAERDALKEENERLTWQLRFCIDHDVKYVKADPLMSVEEFLNDRWEARP